MSIKKIAEMTGASVSTVGRVLRNPNHRCASEEMRKRILQAAREINYVPNEAARNLKSGNASLKDVYHIGVLITRVSSEDSDPFFDEMLRLVEIEIRKNNCIVSVIWHRADFSSEKYGMSADITKVMDEMYENKKQTLDGLIIIGKCCPKILKELKKRQKNIVSINRNSTNHIVDEVICDGKKIALMAMEHLAKCGHKKIGYVGDCHNETRFDGYQRAQMYYHLETDIDYIFDTEPNEAQGYKAMEYFLRMKNPPTGIYCANDILAIGMLKCLNKRKNRYYLPSIVASDDIAEAQYTTPMLTTVALPKEEMVCFAMMLLMNRIQGKHKTVAKLEMEGTLVVRDSCRPINEWNEPEYYI